MVQPKVAGFTRIAATMPFVPSEEELLLAYLADHDVECPRCGYNLRSLRGNICPECGDRVVLQVGLLEPRLGPYLLTVGTCFAGAGAAAFFLALALAYAPSSWWEEQQVAAWLLLGQFTGWSLASGLLLKYRRSFTRLPHSTQRRLAFYAAAVTLAVCVLVIYFFDN